jgi:hypothetical protein
MPRNIRGAATAPEYDLEDTDNEFEFEDTWSQISHLSVQSHSGIAPDPSFQPKGWNTGLIKSGHVPSQSSDESEGCSPVSRGRTIRLACLGRPTTLLSSYTTSILGRHWCRGSRRSPRRIRSGGGDVFTGLGLIGTKLMRCE